MTGDLSAERTGGLAVGRRGILARLGVAAGLLGGARLTLPGVTASFHPDDSGATGGDTAGSVDVDATAVEESATPYAVWQYRPTGVGFRATSPVNVVFPLDSATVGDVIGVFRDAGWLPRPEEYARFAWDREERSYRPQVWSAAETYAGVVGRYHVRCFETDGTLSVQAHVDTPPTPKHRIESYDRGRAAVERLFEWAGWSVDDDRLVLENDTAPDHDGRASVIRS